MTYLIKNLFFPLDTDFKNFGDEAKRLLGIESDGTVTVKLFRRSVDARNRDDIKFCCSVTLETDGKLPSRLRKYSPEPFSVKPYIWEKVKKNNARPVVVGFGPAGMFAALALARAGAEPIVLERGADADSRLTAVSSFFGGGKLDPDTNVQFGEGGAGTFSDGKLATGIKDVRCRTVLSVFAEFGAGADILTEAKPHIGTDVLISVVKGIRSEIIKLGGEVRFLTRFTRLLTENGRVTGVAALCKGEEYTLATDTVILAVGHSARDTFEYLFSADIPMAQKPFAVGARIEHSQEWLDRVQYGRFAGHPALGAADYRLAAHLEDGRGVFSFCMCPGGVVVNASSEADGFVTNGMSYRARDGKNCNAAILVGVDGKDFGFGVLDGMYFQRDIERRAYAVSGGRSCVSETLASFLYKKENILREVAPSIRPKPYLADISSVLPEFVTSSMAKGLIRFDRMLPGFASESAVLTGPETRSSSPVRILRDDDMQSAVKGLYPCGEGAGYAGGITSAAVDGLRAAEAYILRIYEHFNEV